MRGTDNHEANLETVKLAKDYIGKGVCCIDIAGAEALFPTENFGDLFALAKELEIPYTIHAGEADGPKSVWKALEYGTKRLGHGVRSLEDPALIEKIVSEGITLEVCPTSNLHTCMFPSMEEYPLRKLMEAGVKVTINTDNMTVSNISLAKEFGKLIAAFDLTDEEIKGFARNSVNACFADEETKKVLLKKIDEAKEAVALYKNSNPELYDSVCAHFELEAISYIFLMLECHGTISFEEKKGYVDRINHDIEWLNLYKMEAESNMLMPEWISKYE